MRDPDVSARSAGPTVNGMGLRWWPLIAAMGMVVLESCGGGERETASPSSAPGTADAPPLTTAAGAVWADQPHQLAVTVRARLDATANDPTKSAVVVEILGQAQSDGGIDFANAGRALTDAERDAIAPFVEPRSVAFVAPDDVDELEEVEGKVVVSLAQPSLIDGRVAVTSSIRCGDLCATTGANVLEQDPSTGEWTFGEPIGPQAVS